MLFAAPAGADGIFVPPEAVDDPKIPVQRAIVSYRAGVETLIVESTVDGDAETYGWILPVPSEPASVTACGPGTLETMGRLVKPRVIHARLTIFVILGALTAVFALRSRAGFFVGLGVTGLLILAAMRLLGSGAGVVVPPAPVVSTSRVGHYDVTILRPDSGPAVAGWLRSNGFVLSAAHEPAIAELTSMGWYFVAARIVRSDTGPLTPHPLRVVFPTREPIYPMRLTAVSSGPVRLDLFVVGDRQAEVRGLETRFCDRFMERAADPVVGLRARGSVMTGSLTGIRIGHPEVVASMWSSCVVTHLRGEVTRPEDLRVEWSDDPPRVHTVLSRPYLIELSGAVAVWTLAVAIGHSWRQGVRHSRTVGVGVGLAVLLGGGIAAAGFAFRPVVDVTYRPLSDIAREQARMDLYRAAATQPGGARDRIEEARERARDPEFGVEGDVPYGWTMEGDRPVFYDGDATPYEVEEP